MKEISREKLMNYLKKEILDMSKAKKEGDLTEFGEGCLMKCKVIKDYINNGVFDTANDTANHTANQDHLDKLNKLKEYHLDKLKELKIWKN
jgi:hypothetical protein